ncbi:hypothetical protein BSNK01_28380 [Bacillaceae bacterium]
MAVRKAGQVLVDLLIGRNEIPEEAERARQSLERFSEVETGFQRLTQTVNRAGIEIGNRMDYITQRMEQYRQRFIESIQKMENKATTASKMIQYIGEFGSPLRVLDQQLLKIGDRLERIAQKGQPAAVALRLLGPNASMKDLISLIDQIHQGIGRMHAVALGSAVVFGLMTVGMVHLSNAIDGRLIPAFDELKAVWAQALTPFTHVWTEVALKVLQAAEAVGRFFANLAEAHPVLSSMIWGFMYLLPLVTLLSAPLTLVIDRTNALRVAFYAVWSTIKPFVLGFLSIIGTAALVTAAIVSLSAALYMMWQNSAAFRQAVVSAWNAIKQAVVSSLAPIGQAWEQLKTAFMNLVSTLTGAKPQLTSIWQAIGDGVAQAITFIVQNGLPVLAGVLSGFANIVATAMRGAVVAFNWIAQWWRENGSEVKAHVQAVWNVIRTVFSAVAEFIGQKLREIKTWWVQTWPTLKQGLSNAFGGILSALQPLMNAIMSLMRAVWPVIKEIVVSTWNTIKSTISAAISLITNIISAFANLLTGNWKGLWNNIKQIFVSAIQVIWGLLQLWFLGRLGAFFRGAMTGIKNVIVAAWNGILNAIRNALSSIVGAITSRFGHIIATIRVYMSSAINAVRGFHNAFFSAGRNLIEGLGRGIASAAGWIIQKAREIASAVLSRIRSVFRISSPSRVTMEYGRNIVEGLVVGLLQNRQKVVKASDEVSAQIREAFRVWKGLVESQFEIRVAGLDPEKDKSAILRAELQKLTDTVTILKQEAQALYTAWRIAAQAAGENSVQAVRLANDYYGVQVELAKTQAEIKKLKAELANLPAEQVVQQFEQTKNALDTTRQIAVTTFEIMKLRLGENATKAHELLLEVLSLNEQIRIQQERVRAASTAYEEMKKLKGETAEETRKLYLEYLEEEKALAELEVQHRKAQNAVRDHAQALRDLAAEVQAAAEKYRRELAEAAEEYERKVREVNERLAEDERRLWEEYNRNLEQRAKSIANFVGLFEAVESREVSGDALLNVLRTQVDTLQNWAANIQALAARGVDEGLIAELREMGPKAAPEIAALLRMTDEQLTQYVTLWREKQRIAREQAKMELEIQRIETINKIAELRIQAAEQLEQYRLEWQKKNEEIRKNAEEEIKRIHDRFRDLAEASTGYGISVMTNFINGIESQFERLRSTLEAMAAMVDAYMPHSPAKVGPLKRIDEWGPSLVSTLVDGIRASLPRLAGITERMAAVVPGALGNTYYSDEYTTNISGGNTFNITVHASSYEDFKRKLERDLSRFGVRFMG